MKKRRVLLLHDTWRYIWTIYFEPEPEPQRLELRQDDVKDEISITSTVQKSFRFLTVSRARNVVSDRTIEQSPLKRGFVGSLLWLWKTDAELQDILSYDSSSTLNTG